MALNNGVSGIGNGKAASWRHISSIRQKQRRNLSERRHHGEAKRRQCGGAARRIEMYGAGRRQKSVMA